MSAGHKLGSAQLGTILASSFSYVSVLVLVATFSREFAAPRVKAAQARRVS